MTVEESFNNISRLYDVEDLLNTCLETFKEVCQESPLTNAEGDTFISNYESYIIGMNGIHHDVVGSYLDYIMAARES